MPRQSHANPSPMRVRGCSAFERRRGPVATTTAAAAAPIRSRARVQSAEFEAAPPIASPPQPTETMLINGVQVTIPNEDDIDPDLDRYWYFYFQEKKKKKIPRVPNEVFLNIVQYLPIDNTLHQALRGLYFVFGFDRDLITLNYVKRHWLRHPPHFRVQWMRLPPLYRCHFIILQILRANKFPGSRTNIIQSYGLGYGVPPSSVDE
ncbi:hypothetical protein BCR33DRAFT_130494 [Rhizoclosmatium globosum]|uniref:Uncharacterized protein n=1 Tax=Rhizoclosmatium globosum TaxID=329046 RepID=A0A1Y2CHL3_9FUNG|nr:hypothetical protein BCR33DRAFT_130494 [Rhizoclosmatium globosum]|eukprot:ORY46528.1 hypothetical protein BCR33DRAFT_130494 [Rhizoclosmatium globosum]